MIITAFTSYHLWRQIIQRPTQRLPPIRRRIHAPPEVSQFHSVLREQQILGFYVPVDYTTGVHESQGFAELADNGGSYIFLEILFWLGSEDVVDFTAGGIL